MNSDHIFGCAICGRVVADQTPLDKMLADYIKRFGHPPTSLDMQHRICEDCMGWLYEGDTSIMRSAHHGVMPPWTVPGRTLADVSFEAGMKAASGKN